MIHPHFNCASAKAAGLALAFARVEKSRRSIRRVRTERREERVVISILRMLVGRWVGLDCHCRWERKVTGRIRKWRTCGLFKVRSVERAICRLITHLINPVMAETCVPYGPNPALMRC